MRTRTGYLLVSAFFIFIVNSVGMGTSLANEKVSGTPGSEQYTQTFQVKKNIISQQQTASETSNTEINNKATEKFTLDVVEIKAFKKGTTEDGYRVDSVSVGPMGDKNPMDIPYSINAVSEEMMENQQITTLKEVSKYLPSMQIEERGGPDVGRPQTRGFQGTVSENNRMDGMNIAVTTSYPMEQFERIEVLNGLAGSFYGPANPSGTFNFVLKRPTDKPFFKIAGDYSTHSKSNVHADAGGPIGKKFGYRLNLLYNDGEGYVNRSNLRRKLASLSLDWKVTNNTTAEFNFSSYDFNLKGYPGGFGYAANIKLPDALDPTRIGYGQSWAGHELNTQTASMRIKHNFNENWHIIAGFLDQVANRDMITVSNTLTDNKGNYRTTFRPSSSAWEVDSGIMYLNGRINTGSLAHDVSIGINGHERRMMSADTSMPQITLGVANIENPMSYNEPFWWVDSHRYKASVMDNYAFILGDTITFNKSWSVMLSASYSWLSARNYNVNGVSTGRYNDSGISPAGSLIYKPRENITAYITYADSLQQGATAPATAANPNETLAPYRSEQWETGLKVALGKINLSGALFRIERPFPYTDTDNVFRVQGNQVNYGLELMAIGKVIDSVTIYAGVTLLDPKLNRTGNSTTSDKQVVGVPEGQANLLVEYQTPFIKGLTPYLNLHYTGKRPANDANTSWASAYSTIDIGTRYTTKIKNVETTWMLSVKNLTDERYWASVMPGSTDGTGAACSAFPGTPREIMGSMQVKF